MEHKNKKMCQELPVIPNYLEPCIANIFFHKVVLGELVIDSVLAQTV